MAIEVGKAAPQFTLVDHQGEKHALKSHKGKNKVVLFFYPKDDTPG